MTPTLHTLPAPRLDAAKRALCRDLETAIRFIQHDRVDLAAEATAWANDQIKTLCDARALTSREGKSA